MKISIDCRSLAWKHSGIARYLHNVLLELSKIDKKNEYYLLANGSVDLSEYNFKNCNKMNFSTNDLIYKYWITPNFLQKESIDIYWSPTQELPLWKPKKCRYIATIHDAAMEHDMSPYSLKVRVLHSLGLYAYSAKIADSIFTDSNFSKGDIAKMYKVSVEKIVVTYLGIDEKFKKIDKSKAEQYVKKHLNVKAPYIFMVNTGRPRNVIKAFEALCKKEWKDNNVNLIILGKSVESESVSKLINNNGILDRVINITEHVSDVDLNNLYSGAEFFISASYFEGFGLTPGESLKSGCPILISNVTALPEIYRDAALYCDPYDKRDISKKMLLFLSNNKLKHELEQKSVEVIKEYEWKSISEKILVTFAQYV